MTATVAGEPETQGFMEPACHFQPLGRHWDERRNGDAGSRADFKKWVALEALPGVRTVQAIAAKHEVNPNQVGAWKRGAIERLDEVFARGGSPGPSEHEATIRDLHAKLGELTMERDGTGFFSAGVAALSRPARRNLVDRDGALSIRRQCALLASAARRCTTRAAGREREEPWR